MFNAYARKYGNRAWAMDITIRTMQEDQAESVAMTAFIDEYMEQLDKEFNSATASQENGEYIPSEIEGRRTVNGNTDTVLPKQGLHIRRPPTEV